MSLESIGSILLERFGIHARDLGLIDIKIA